MVEGEAKGLRGEKGEVDAIEGRVGEYEVVGGLGVYFFDVDGFVGGGEEVETMIYLITVI